MGVTPAAPSPLRVAKSRATTAWRSRWYAKHRNVPFDEQRSVEGSDYNLHHVDLETDGAAQDELVAGMNMILAAGTVDEVDQALAELTAS